MKFVKQYWLKAIFLGSWVCLWLFLPNPKMYYTVSDIDLFKQTVKGIVMIGLSIAFVVALVVMLINIRPLSNIVPGLMVVGFYLAFFYLFLSNVLPSLGLLINRQSSRGNVARSYVVSYMKGDTSIDDVFLYDVRAHILTLDDELIRTAKVSRSSLTAGDTLHAEFSKGLFGVPYFDSTAFVLRGSSWSRGGRRD